MTRKQERSVRGAAVVALALGAVGCGLMVDAERAQCASAETCAAQLGGAATGYTCVEGLCRTAAPECTAATTATDCGDSPTAQCVDGKCVDDVWGCWDEPDNRPAPTGTTATVNLKFLTVFQQPPGTLNAVACQSSTIDPACGSPLPGTSPSYDAATGALKLRNVQVRPIYVSYRIKVEDPASGSAIDYYANRQPRDADSESLLTLIPAGAAQALPVALRPDPTLANVIVRVVDCKGNTASGVEVSMVDAPANIGRFYIDDAGNPAPTLTRTAALGVANIYNVPINRAVTLQARVSPTKQLTYSLTAFPDRYAYIDLFPRK